MKEIYTVFSTKRDSLWSWRFQELLDLDNWLQEEGGGGNTRKFLRSVKVTMYKYLVNTSVTTGVTVWLTGVFLLVHYWGCHFKPWFIEISTDVQQAN